MTQRQIDVLKESLPKWKNGVAPQLNQREQLISQIVNIADMMLSNLAYGGDYFEMVQEPWYQRNKDPDGYDWDKLENLGIINGLEFVVLLWRQMQEDFAVYGILCREAYTDSEGCSYNNIVWTDTNVNYDANEIVVTKIYSILERCDSNA